MAPATGALVGLTNYSSIANAVDPIPSSVLPQMITANIAALAIGGFVSFALIVWDFITFLPDEIRLLKDFRKVSWRSPDPFCFLVVRYTALSYALTALFSLALKTSSCQSVISLAQLFSIFVLSSAAILAAKRTTSLWVRDNYRIVMGLTGVLAAFMAISWIAVATQHRAFQVPEYVDYYPDAQPNLPEYGTNCGLEPLPSWHPLSYIASTLFFGTTLALALLRWSRQRTERVLNLGLTPLNRACIWYLLVSFIASLALLVVYGSAGSQWSNDVSRRIAQPFWVLLVAGMAQRLYLNSQADMKLRREHIQEMQKQDLKPRMPRWSWGAHVSKARSRTSNGLVTGLDSPSSGIGITFASMEAPGKFKKNSVSTIGSTSQGSPHVPSLSFGNGPSAYPRPPPPPIPEGSVTLSPLPPQHLAILEKQGITRPGSKDGQSVPRKGSEGSVREKAAAEVCKAVKEIKEKDERDMRKIAPNFQIPKSTFYSTTASNPSTTAESPSSLAYMKTPSDYAMSPAPDSSTSGQFLHLTPTPTTASHYPLSSLHSPAEGLKNFKFNSGTSSHPGNVIQYSGEGVDPLTPLPMSPNGGQYAKAPAVPSLPQLIPPTYTPPNHTPDVPDDSPASPTTPISPATGHTSVMFSPVSTIGFGSPPNSPPVLGLPWPGGKPPSGGKKAMAGSSNSKAMAVLGGTGKPNVHGHHVRKVGSRGSMRRGGRGGVAVQRVGRSTLGDTKKFGSFRSGWND
ncbi:hypothetical protein BKA70DRAFT_883070 [Coprinopsis sp. MPI-PUGE-AT-0042]|nr:hypothetical protein BKA70DRAFT_883070 [Coprinopsis sp. MPI-PUGE-AT-0042]